MSTTLPPHQETLEKLPRWFSDLEQNQIDTLHYFVQQLLHFNSKLNLISRFTERFFVRDHLADSICAARHVGTIDASTSVYDVGSGNGFPGIVFAILYPSRQVFLVESDLRKSEFLKFVAGKLQLRNVLVKNCRFEDIEVDTIECAISRAFAHIGKALMWARKPFKVGGSYYHLKSESWPREMSEVPPQVLQYWAPKHVVDYVLPESDIKHSVVVTKKIQ